MARFEKRRKIQSMLYNRYTVILLAVVAVLLGFSAFSVFQKRQEAYTNEQTAAYEVKTLTAEEEKTQDQISKLQTDQGVEEAIRNEYQASSDGEGLVVVVDSDQKDTTDVPMAAPQPPKSWWQKVISFLHL